jgi:hypothetical protein
VTLKELLNSLVPHETHAYCEKHGLRLNGRKPEQHRRLTLVQGIISRPGAISNKASLDDETTIIGEVQLGGQKGGYVSKD